MLSIVDGLVTLRFAHIKEFVGGFRVLLEILQFLIIGSYQYVGHDGLWFAGGHEPVAVSNAVLRGLAAFFYHALGEITGGLGELGIVQGYQRLQRRVGARPFYHAFLACGCIKNCH